MNNTMSSPLLRKGLYPILSIFGVLFACGLLAGNAQAQIEDLNAPQRTITKIVSLEDEHYKVENAHLTIGRDGRGIWRPRSAKKATTRRVPAPSIKRAAPMRGTSNSGLTPTPKFAPRSRRSNDR